MPATHRRAAGPRRRRAGTGHSDRVAIVGPNCHRYVELYQAVPGAGMVLVPLNQRHTDAELNYALADSETRVLFTNRVVEGLAVLRRARDRPRGRLREAARWRRSRRLPERPARHARSPASSTRAARPVRRRASCSRTATSSRTRCTSMAVRPLPARHVLADRGAAVPRRRLDRRACRPCGTAAGRSCCLHSTPSVALDLIERHGVTAHAASSRRCLRR